MDKPDVPPASPRSSRIVKETEMKNFAITIAAVLVSVPAILPAGAADTQPTSSNDVLGFDETKIRPPDAEKGEPIARLFYDYLDDQDNRQKFWHYFVRQHPFQVPPKDIDFDKPWWMQKK